MCFYYLGQVKLGLIRTYIMDYDSMQELFTFLSKIQGDLVLKRHFERKNQNLLNAQLKSIFSPLILKF